MPEDLPTPQKSLKQLEKENNRSFTDDHVKKWQMNEDNSMFSARLRKEIL